jgi:hypothetical protein
MNGGDELARWRRVHQEAVRQGNTALAQQAMEQIQGLTQQANAAEDTSTDFGSVPAFLGSAADAASLGLGGPMRGVVEGVQQALPRVVGGAGGSFGAGYGAGEARYRAGLANLQAGHPVADVAGSVLGSVALPGASLKQIGALTPAAKLATRVGGGAVVGGTTGGIMGLTGSEGPLSERLASGGQGAAEGALLGALLSGTIGAGVDRYEGRRLNVLEKDAQRRFYEARARQATQQTAQHGAATVAPASGATAEELAVAKRLGIPVEMVRGRVGQAAMQSPRGAPVPHPPEAAGGGEIQPAGRLLTQAETRARTEARFVGRKPTFQRRAEAMPTTKGETLPATGTGETASATVGQPSPRPLTSFEQQVRTHETPGVKTAPPPPAGDVYGPTVHPTEQAQGGTLEPSVVGGRTYRMHHRPFVPATDAEGKAQVTERLAKAGGPPVRDLASFSDAQLQQLLHASQFDPSVPSLSPTEHAAVLEELRRRATTP